MDHDLPVPVLIVCLSWCELILQAECTRCEAYRSSSAGEV